MDSHQSTILVIDDEPEFAKFVKDAASEFGRSVACVTSKSEFFDTYRPTFETIVLDLNMPEFDGIEVIRHLADTSFKGSIVMLSGAFEGLVHGARKLAEARGLHVAATLFKPVHIANLERALTAKPQPRVTTLDKPTVATLRIDEADLRAALEYGEIVPFYQPKANVRTGEIVGFEALARWRHSRFGVLTPGLFLPSIERFGLMDEMTDVLLDSVVQDIGRMQREGVQTCVAINIEAESLEELTLPERIIGRLGIGAIPPQSIVIEVTENGAATTQTNVIDNLLRLRMRGFKLAIDDFGTGHSTLAQLQRLPFDQIKIDKSFVDGIGYSAEDEAIITSTVDLAKKLRLEIVGEGVETRAQLNFLRDIGCDQVQGYLIGRPEAIDDMPVWNRGVKANRTHSA